MNPGEALTTLYQDMVLKRGVIIGCPYCDSIIGIPSLKNDGSYLCVKCLKVFDKPKPESPTLARSERP